MWIKTNTDEMVNSDHIVKIFSYYGKDTQCDTVDGRRITISKSENYVDDIVKNIISEVKYMEVQ